jgi:hypothetical protein
MCVNERGNPQNPSKWVVLAVASDLKSGVAVKFKLTYNDYLLLLGIVVAIAVSVTTLIKAFTPKSQTKPVVSITFKNRIADITDIASVRLFNRIYRQR